MFFFDRVDRQPEDVMINRDLTGSSRGRAVVSASIPLLLAMALVSCGEGGKVSLSTYFKDPNGETIKAALKTNIPLAYSASVAMSAVTGSMPANASTTNVCSFPDPCTAVVTIQDDDSAMPLRLGNFGTIHVYGYWTSSDEAIMTVVFGSDAGSSLFPVHDINLVPVSRTGRTLRLVYTDIDVNQTFKDPATLQQPEIDNILTKLTITASPDASQNMNMDAWVIETDTAGTAAVSDDTYTLSGAGIYFNASQQAAALHQLAMAQVVMASDCALNPTSSGAAVIQEIDSRSANSMLGQAVFGFHSACDGSAQVLVGNGNYLLSTGKSIPLHLNTP